MDIPGIAKLYCPECGQKLAVPTKDLRTRYRCPRCQTVHSGADLVPKRGTVPAVPVEESVTYESDLAPEVVGRVHDTLIEEPPPATVPMPTVPIPTAPGPVAARPATQPMPARPAAPPAAPYQPPPAALPAFQHQPPPVPWPAPAPMYQPLPPQPATPPHLVYPQPPPQGWGAPQANPSPPALLAPPAPAPAGPLAAPPGIAPGAAFAAVGQVGAQGLAATGAFTRWLVRLAGRVDLRLHGWRARLVGGSAALVVVMGWVDEVWYAILLSAFFLLLLVLLFGRIAACRDGETGEFSWSVAGTRFVSAFGGAWSALMTFFSSETTPLERAREAGWASLFTGVLALALRAPILYVARQFYDSPREFDLAGWDDVANWTQGVGVLLVALGVGLHLWRISKRQTRRAADGTTRPLVVDAGTASADALRLPASIDACEGLTHLPGLDLSDGVLPRLIVALSTWRTRAQRLEDGYRRSLLRHLRNTMPDAALDTERPVVDELGQLGYLDITVANTIAIELKPRLNGTTAQRAVGQVRQYLGSWKAGPVILVVCETEDRFDGTFAARQIREFHDVSKQPVLAVAAGVRRRS